MKRPIFIMLVLVAIAFAGPMLIKKPDGTPFMELPSIELPSAEESWDSSNNFSKGETNQSFYKWQDEDGTWHYSDEAPAGKTVETITVNTNTNLIQGLRVEKDKIENIGNESDIKKKQAIEETSVIPLPMTVPIDKVTEMLKDARNIQSVIDNRAKQIEQATGG